MRGRTAAFALLAAGALAVLVVGSYATADSGKKNVSTGPMSGYLEGAPSGPVSSPAHGDRRQPSLPRAATALVALLGLPEKISSVARAGPPDPGDDAEVARFGLRGVHLPLPAAARRQPLP